MRLTLLVVVKRLFFDVRHNSCELPAKQYSWRSVHHDYVIDMDRLEVIFWSYTLQFALPGRLALKSLWKLS